MTLVESVFKAMFSGGAGFVRRGNGDIHLLGRTRTGLRRTTIGGHLYIEQNPHKKSKWAALARKGERIMWVIHKATNTYVARVHDGKIERL